MISDNKLKVCVIENMASHYRAAIFKLIDEEYNCEWYYGKGFQGIKDLPLSFFKHAEYTPLKKFIKEPLYRQVGLIKLLNSEKYDVILCAGEIINVSFWWFLIVHRLFRKGPKIYDWGHGMLRVRNWPRNWIEKLFYKLFDGMFLYGNKARELMIAQGFDENRIFVIHNSLNYEEQLKYRGNFSDIYRNHFGNNNPVLYFIGRLTKVKKLDMLVNAVDLLRKKNIETNLVFIGDGVVKEELQALVQELKLEDRVWFYGACYDEREKSELMANADLCVAPGNIGLTAMDTLMYGTPAITMDNFGMQMPEHEAIKEGKTGAFFKENDVYDLTEQIQKWLNNGYNRDQIRKNCYREIDENWNPQYQISVIKKNLRK